MGKSVKGTTKFTKPVKRMTTYDKGRKSVNTSIVKGKNPAKVK
jgi:hypothetical protein